MSSLLLSIEQRARLRPTVDVMALERLLAKLPEEARPGVVLACVAAPSWEELAAEAVRAGAPVPPAPTCASVAPPGPPGGGPVPSLQIAFKDPALERLWRQVEPRPC